MTLTQLQGIQPQINTATSGIQINKTALNAIRTTLEAPYLSTWWNKKISPSGMMYVNAEGEFDVSDPSLFEILRHSTADYDYIK